MLGMTLSDPHYPPLPLQMLHEEIAWAWVLNHQDARHRKTILTNAWFLFDIMVSL